MPDDKLVRVTGAAGALEQRIDPKVLSKADPSAEWLLDARSCVSKAGGLFKQAMEEDKGDEWLVAQLAIRLVGWWKDTQEDQARECAQYLVDEYNQLGEGVHLISKETGKVIITLTDDDIYQPAMVPRHGGGMTTPLKRLRPDLEAALTTWTFERGREAKIVATLAARGHQTTLLREEGDPRLLVATRKGRSEIVRSLTDFTPKALLKRCGGTAGAFLRHFDLVTELENANEATITWSLEGHVSARSIMGVQDQTTVNLHHSRQQTLRGVLPQGWIREIARHIATFVHQKRKVAQGKPAGKWLKPYLDEAPFWVAPPELVTPFRRLDPKLTVLPVDRALPIGFTKPKVGIIVVPESFSAESHEMFERWEAVANLDYKVWVDWGKVTCLAVQVEYQGVVETRP